MRRLWVFLISCFAVAVASCDRHPTSPDAGSLEGLEPEFSIQAPVGHLSAGDGFTCAVGMDDGLDCWGFNWYGQALPVEGTFTQASAGYMHACGLDTDGVIHCWGPDWWGLLNPPEGSFTKVSLGSAHGCGLGTDGTIDCWGYEGPWTDPPTGQFTQVDAGGKTNCAVSSGGSLECWGSPGGILDGPPPEGTFTQVSVVYSRACALDTEGAIHCWGPGWSGALPPSTQGFRQIDLGGGVACALGSDGAISCWGSSQYGVLFPPTGTFTQVAVGSTHACAARSDGSIECWGGSSPYDGTTSNIVEGPFEAVTHGYFHGCGLREDGTVKCWGSSSHGQAFSPPDNFTQVSAGPYHNCGVTTEGTTKCWGANWYGQGYPPQGASFIEVHAGMSHTCGIDEQGDVTCWGWSADDRLAVPNKTFSKLSVGPEHSCGLTTAGVVECWGRYGVGQPNPSGAAGFVSVSAGGYLDCALRSDGSTECWGGYWGWNPGIGFGVIPVTPPPDAFVQVSSALGHACGIREADGTVACWGKMGFTYGQEEVVPPAGTFEVLASGGSTTCGIAGDGATECWGRYRTTTVFLPGATPVGTDVEVRPIDLASGDLGPVTLTFDEVTASGETTVERSTEAPPEPLTLSLGEPATSFDIITTASFTGNVEVCVDYTGVTFNPGNENDLELLHYDSVPTERWDVITTSKDTDANIICGSTTSFSIFQVLEGHVADITAIGLPQAPVAVGTATSLTATFTHPTASGGFTAEVEWGDGNVTNGVVTQPAGGIPGSIFANHTYQTAGVYTVTVQLHEGPVVVSRSSAQEATTSFLVVFDPNGGYVTGGGWIDSPPGACLFAACTVETTGKATFGFVSRYENGANTPDGNTVFHFKAGDLRFHSSSYDWMVPAGSKAQFKGSGQINKEGDYGFMITAIDGDLRPQGGEDQFRIKIWDKSTGQVVYDNKLGEAVDGDAATVLGGGSIVIHK